MLYKAKNLQTPWKTKNCLPFQALIDVTKNERKVAFFIIQGEAIVVSCMVRQPDIFFTNWF